MVDFGGRRSGFEDDDNYYGRQNILRESPITLESKKQAQQKTPSFGLGELLAGLAGLGKGITDSAINVGKSTIGAIGTGITSAMDLMGGEESRKGYNEGKNTDAFKRWLYGTDSKGQINYGKAAGEALDAATTLTNFIPGGGKLAANVAQGAVSGLANEYKEKGNDADLGNALKSAATGAVTGAATSKVNDFVGKKIGNLAEKQAVDQLGTIGQKILNAGRSNFVRGAISGATGGAVGGGMATALNGGDLGQVLGNAVSTAGSGALQGGISGSVTGAIRNTKDLAVDKIRSAYVDGKLPIPQTDLTPNAGVKRRLESSFENGLTGDFEEGKNWVGRLKTDDVSTANNIQNALGRQNINEDGNIYLDNYNAAEHAQKRFAENPQKNTPESLANTAYNAMFGDGKEILPNNSSNPNSVAFVNKNDPNGVVPVGVKGENNEILSVIPSRREIRTLKRHQESIKKGMSPESDSIDNIPQGTRSVNNAFDQNIEFIQNKNRLQQFGKQLQNTANVQKYRGLYDSLDAKTAKRAVATNAPKTLSDLGVNPQDYAEYAKTSSYVNKVVSDLAKKSGVKTNLPNLADDLSLDNSDLLLSDTAAKKYNNYISKIVADGSNPAEYSASYLLEKSRELGNKAANMRENTDDITMLKQALTDAKYILRDAATKALTDNYITGDDTNAMIAQGLKQLGANQKVQDYYTEAVNGEAPTISDYIRRSSLFEQARDMGNQMEAEKYTRSASKAPKNWGTRLYESTGLDKPIETVLNNTISPMASKVTGLIGRVIEGAGNLKAGTQDVPPRINHAQNSQSQSSNTNLRNAPDLISLILGREVIPQTALNMIGRGVGNDSTYKVQNAMRANANDSMSDYNSQDLVGNNINHVSQQSRIDNSSITEQLTKIGDAMQLALNAGDAASYSKLAGLYGDMMNIYKTQQTIFNPQAKATKLTDSQKKANVAMDLLNNLEGQQANIGSAVADVPILGGLMNIGGNEYKSSAEALESALGYLQSGAQISEKERESIRRAYIPQWGESEAVKKRKLAAARQVIQNFARANAEE